MRGRGGLVVNAATARVSRARYTDRMNRLYHTAATLTVLALIVPTTALAFPFGGQVSTVKPCYNRAIFAQVGPPRGGAYIWTPSTKTYEFGAPSFSGQWLLGLASAPYFCVVSIMPVDVWSGIAIDMMGSSGGGSYSNLLHAAPATTAAPPQIKAGGGSSGGGGASGSY